MVARKEGRVDRAIKSKLARFAGSRSSKQRTVRDVSTSVDMTAISKLRDHHADTAIILGSGLNSLVVDPAKDQIVPYADFSEIPQPSVPGHIGRFVLGQIEKRKTIFAQGRVHLYEGYSPREVTSIVRVLAEAGIKQLIVTNAAGSLNTKFKP